MAHPINTPMCRPWRVYVFQVIGPLDPLLCDKQRVKHENPGPFVDWRGPTEKVPVG